ncbi:hypothetical protein MAR_025632 [Mya arenaria]|uniref:Uncharacterized protein n=1 Tax=Mya arenaria TaxID=6604 RepID=A0ABY7EN79_MYAAR|nr:hypothetical protein MAR_025632 [Mya arenaria]
MAIAKSHITILLAVTVFFLVAIRLYYDKETYLTLYKNEANKAEERLQRYLTGGVDKNDDVYFTMSRLVEQRNNISRILNKKQQKIGQLECEISSTGGWCAQSSVENSGQHKTDTQLVPVLAEFFKGQEGYSHINMRTFEYVKDLFDKLGFDHDAESSEKLKKASKLEWLRTNTNVYRRRDTSNIEHLKTFLT